MSYLWAVKQQERAGVSRRRGLFTSSAQPAAYPSRLSSAVLQRGLHFILPPSRRQKPAARNRLHDPCKGCAWLDWPFILQ
jgi:hypothetical protein